MKNYCILLHGRMRSGKNQTDEFIEQALKLKGYNVILDSFAAPLKSMCEKAFEPLTDYLKSEYNIQTISDNWYNEKTPITRMLLQAVGTEIVRNTNSDYWVDQAAKRIKKQIFFNNKKDKLVFGRTRGDIVSRELYGRY